ncbi:transport protein Avl9-domain-containing protein [Blastocladiella britannica]|nr:transport protein Avl9-domain-containing protein [Blastocladiella britannica]
MSDPLSKQYISKMVSLVHHILVVAFHHTLGPCVEYAYPPLSGMAISDPAPTGSKLAIELPPAWAAVLPFCALPDGAHAADGAAHAFVLPPAGIAADGWEWANGAVFATSYYRQIDAETLAVRTPDISRKMVQKSIVVLSRVPLLGALQSPLEQVTREYFDQRDFTRRAVLDSFFDSAVTRFASIPEDDLGKDIRLGEFVSVFRAKGLVLFKLMLMQKRIVFYSTDVTRLVQAQYAMYNLFPDFVTHTLPALGSPEELAPISLPQIQLANPFTPFATEKHEPLARRALYKGLAFPLALYPAGSLVQPYLPLQQLDDVARSAGGVGIGGVTVPVLVGTTNAMVRDYAAAKWDVVVDLDAAATAAASAGTPVALAGTTPPPDAAAPIAPAANPVSAATVMSPSIEVMPLSGPAVAAASNLSTPDKKWISDLVDRVALMVAAGDSVDVVNANVRAEFEHYLLAMLATASAYAADLDNGASAPTAAVDGAPSDVPAPDSPHDEPDLASSTQVPLAASSGGAQTNPNASGAEDPLVAARAARRAAAAEFHLAFITHLISTVAFERFLASHDPATLACVPSTHPCHGYTLAAHLKGKIEGKIAELHLDEKKRAVQAGLATAAERAGVVAGVVGERAGVVAGVVGEKAGAIAARVREEAARRAADTGPIVSEERKEELILKTAMAASKAKQFGVSIWGAASSYIATKRATYVRFSKFISMNEK